MLKAQFNTYICEASRGMPVGKVVKFFPIQSTATPSPYLSLTHVRQADGQIIASENLACHSTKPRRTKTRQSHCFMITKSLLTNYRIKSPLRCSDPCFSWMIETNTTTKPQLYCIGFHTLWYTTINQSQFSALYLATEKWQIKCVAWSLRISLNIFRLSKFLEFVIAYSCQDFFNIPLTKLQI